MPRTSSTSPPPISHTHITHITHISCSTRATHLTLATSPQVSAELLLAIAPPSIAPPALLRTATPEPEKESTTHHRNRSSSHERTSHGTTTTTTAMPTSYDYLCCERSQLTTAASSRPTTARSASSRPTTAQSTSSTRSGASFAQLSLAPRRVEVRRPTSHPNSRPNSRGSSTAGPQRGRRPVGGRQPAVEAEGGGAARLGFDERAKRSFGLIDLAGSGSVGKRELYAAPSSSIPPRRQSYP